ncbi:MAG: efflux RND transporter periplasmic adaptor subunit [Planctomycetia bacterium]|nr:efflux RND transporter periplasmic adaptor subunit [Planctomycetia bacterium]
MALEFHDPRAGGRPVGKLDYDERHVAFIASRVAGRVDRTYADFTGMTVKKGDHLVDIHSPDLYSGERELLIALEGRSESLVEASRTKVALLGLLPEQIRETETTKKPRTHVKQA